MECPEWRISPHPVDYLTAVHAMEERVAAIRAGTQPEQIWLLEHPPLYTAGTSAKDNDLLDDHGFPVHHTGRGGQYTYHGPGQRVVYVMLDLQKRDRDIRAFVEKLEQWIIHTLAQFNIVGQRRAGRIGIWVDAQSPQTAIRDQPSADRQPRTREAKIAAVGLRVRKWVSYHGIAINVDPDLSHFQGIVPCGISDYGVTSLVDLGLPVTMPDVDMALYQSFEEIFGPVSTV